MEVSLFDILEAFSISAYVPNRMINNRTELLDLIRMCFRLTELLNEIGNNPDEEDDI